MTRVLVVDDDPNMRDMIQKLLIAQGYQVQQVTNGEEAVNVMTSAAIAEMPDVVVMDLMMPQMNGFEALQKLKSTPSTARVPVIIVTARNQTADETRARRMGAVDYITKPWPSGELEDRVRIALSSRRSAYIRMA
ncbi:MAG: response regulator [SAR202 cluster bacterium]|nr:response regulator [SAR202 cluster bacterium]